jgi:flavin-binding protein dodecin
MRRDGEQFSASRRIVSSPSTTMEYVMAKKEKSGTKAKSGSSVYKVIEIVGTSKDSWADAARNAIKSASKSVRDLRVAEVSKLDVKIGKDNELVFRSKLHLSFKYHGD